MRVVLLFMLYCLGQNQSHAQTESVLKFSYSKIDTLQAVQQLFEEKREGSQIYLRFGPPLVLIGGGAAFLVSTLASTIKLGKGKEQILPTTLFGGGIGLIALGIGLTKLIRFGRGRESSILEAYEVGNPLPRRIQHKLKHRYFK